MILNDIDNLIEETLGKTLGKAALGAGAGLAAVAAVPALASLYANQAIINPVKNLANLGGSGIGYLAGNSSLIPKIRVTTGGLATGIIGSTLIRKIKDPYQIKENSK